MGLDFVVFFQHDSNSFSDCLGSGGVVILSNKIINQAQISFRNVQSYLFHLQHLYRLSSCLNRGIDRGIGICISSSLIGPCSILNSKILSKAFRLA